MQFSELSPHVHFLNNAGHLLSRTVPETSAFLMSRRTELLVENDIPMSDVHRQHVCSACGHIMIPGQHQDSLKIETDKAALRRNPSRAQQTAAAATQPRAMPGGVSKVMTCGSCFRKTRFKLDGPKRISRVRKATQLRKGSDEGKVHAAGEPVKASSANASSKKRAKNRKAGLQALLDQKQSPVSSSGLGLSLSDFMKK